MLQKKVNATLVVLVYVLALAAPATMGHATPKLTAPVVATPDFTMSVTPTFVTRKRGTGFLWDISVTAVNGFNGTVNFTVTGLFPGASIPSSFEPTPVTGSGTSNFGILTQKVVTPQGTFTLTVTGTSGSISHSQSVQIQMV